MNNFIKGLLGGIGNITPGLSGSAILIILGVYENCIHAISNIFKDFKNSFLYLFPIGVGILVGTFLFSNVILFSLNKYPLATSIIFVCFMIGTLPSLFKNVNEFKPLYLIPFVITFLLGIILLFYKNTYSFNINETSYISLILVGIIIAISTIIPGISSTILLNIIGMYKIYITSINTLDIKTLFFIGIGVFIGFLYLSKLIDFLLKKYHDYTFYAIIGFVISTIPALFMVPITINTEFFIGVFLGIIALFITYKLS